MTLLTVRPCCLTLPFCIFLLLFFSFPCLANNDDLTGTRKRLSAITERLRVAEDAVRKNKADLSQVWNELDNLQKERDRIGKRIARIKRQQSELSEKIRTTNSEIGKLQKSFAARSALLQKRLIAMYKGGSSGVLPVLFGADSAGGAYEDSLYFSRVAANDQELLKESRQHRERLARELTELETLESRQERNRTALIAERRELNNAKRLKSGVLKRLKGQGGGLEKSLAELRQKEEQLRALVKKLESTQSAKYTRGEKVGNTDFSRQRGRLRSPVAAPVKIGFGVRKRPGDGVLVDSHGLEFELSPGQPVNAIWRGRVVFADSFRGFGKLLIVDHGEGYYSLYAHAEKLLKDAGDNVISGEQIALGGTRCYFEIRHQGAPINPKPWLKL